MSTNYSLLFYLKKPKNYAVGAKPIYMRITVAGEPKEVSIGRGCDPSRWNAKANRAKGTKEDIRGLNAYLDTLERKVADAHVQLVWGQASRAMPNFRLLHSHRGMAIWRNVRTARFGPATKRGDIRCSHRAAPPPLGQSWGIKQGYG